MKTALFTIITLMFFFTEAQVEITSKLHQNLKKNDSLLFTEGLNKCDVKLMGTLIHTDFEFYHDKGGITKGKEEFLKTVNNGPCKFGTVQNKRELVEGTLEVFPLYNNGKLYGAIQQGIHKFSTSTPKFTHLWLLENNEWKIARVLSYDH